MPAYKDAQKGTWYAAFYYQDWKGVKKKKLKRGFPTKKEALAWERTFLLQQAADLTMTFEAFVEIYIVDKQNRLRENTWSTKEHMLSDMEKVFSYTNFQMQSALEEKQEAWKEIQKYYTNDRNMSKALRFAKGETAQQCKEYLSGLHKAAEELLKNQKQHEQAEADEKKKLFTTSCPRQQSVQIKS